MLYLFLLVAYLSLKKVNTINGVSFDKGLQIVEFVFKLFHFAFFILILTESKGKLEEIMQMILKN